MHGTSTCYEFGSLKNFLLPRGALGGQASVPKEKG